MAFLFRSPVGVFVIREKAGRWQLWIDDGLLGSYHSPEAAADDVRAHVTGWPEWDERRASPHDPADLSEWERRPSGAGT